MGATTDGVSTANASTLRRTLDQAISGAPWRVPTKLQRHDPQPLREPPDRRDVSPDRDARARTPRARRPKQTTDGEADKDLRP